MKIFLLILAIFICSTQFSFSQEDGVVSLAIPVRSSLKFNRYLSNPTFSFVREQNTYINLTNKREWVQFEDAPQTYLINYSGRYSENIGVGVGLFQQNYGVLTTFGGVLNFAYNARLQTDSNLTFGLNLGFYKSSLNDGKVVVNEADPSFDNIPKNTVLSVSPGINYGLVFFDFGLSINNLVQYNIKSSELIKEDPQQSIQAHVMYTGYMYSRGFFDQSKFSALIKSEFKKDQTIFSGIAMLMVPKGIWAQLGYNTVYGLTGGVGVNITKQISVEYNYEKAMGDLASFGSSHEFTLAYKLNTRNRYQYSGDDREEALLIKDQKRKPAISNKPTLSAEERAQLAEQKAAERAANQEAARLATETRASERLAAQEQARLDGEAKAQALAEAQAAEQTQSADAEANKISAAQAQADEAARLAAEAAAQAQADEAARLAAEAAAQAQADEAARLAAEAAAQAQADEAARLA
ncbi:PorP/SprF family type IX secretion system membrane protein, partial [Xanthomarina sp. F2636L]|uniref:PorP/SprF family type IX secretion system membrane protein n=1 Tax=Xanthomarina sp. F2636L TaxID=2996018 RepID=UPI00225DD119